MSYPDAWLDDPNAPRLTRERVLQLIKEAGKLNFEDGFISRFKDQCLNGKHNFKVILRIGYDGDINAVVNWCQTCGAVVVDGEYDGRLSPGAIKRMQVPDGAKQIDSVLYLKKERPMTEREMFERSFKRPSNFFKLSGEEQWAIDKKLGILDWIGEDLTTEDNKRFDEHYDK